MMNAQDKKLHVENLTISFKTSNGKVQAVRGINFDLYRGETLAIVGESGSGKSVTSKAVLGILAGNSLIEGGEIVYDGQDLLRISEEDFHKIRGDKIAMIFQDPMSSLNPIVRIGKQLTEAMILKGKARQKESRILFNDKLAALNSAMIGALASDDAALAQALTQKCKDFDTFERKHLELESAYNVANQAAVEASSEIESLVLEVEKNAAKDLKYRVSHVKKLAERSIQTYVVNSRREELQQLLGNIPAAMAKYKADKKDGMLADVLAKIRAVLDEAVAYPVPNFFTMGYYLTFSGQALPDMETQALNEFLHKYAEEHFMTDFFADVQKALQYSAGVTAQNRVKAVQVLEQAKAFFAVDDWEKNACRETLTGLDKAVADSLDPLALKKDSTVCTFSVALRSKVEAYFDGIVKNRKEEARFAKQTAHHDKLVAAGKNPDWEVAPKSLVNLAMLKADIARMIDQLAAHYAELDAFDAERKYADEAEAVIDYLKEKASNVVLKVTPAMAKEHALKLMEEVGISEPRKRFMQYPFEFSGGMRQRIVIAIALAANPDILICDEPTTALDVTIQSQILELINKLKKERNLSIIFITHDLGVVANMADRIAVMYAGKIVECGTAEEVFYSPAHPYTWALLSSMPDLDTNGKLEAIPGTPPNMIYPPVGDAFAERNKYAMKIDFEMQPPMFKITDTHYAATWLLHPDAPKVDIPQVITDRIARMKAKRGANDVK